MFVINGKTFNGNNISINGDKIIIDGIEVKDKDILSSKEISITVEGNIDNLSVDNCTSIAVHGSVNNLQSVRGSIHVVNVNGDIKSTSGDIDIKSHVVGNINTVSGDVSCGNITGNIKTISGDIKYKKI
jgi:hypothetical protein